MNVYTYGLCMIVCVYVCMGVVCVCVSASVRARVCVCVCVHLTCIRHTCLKALFKKDINNA